jgi:tagaturonate reductase
MNLSRAAFQQPDKAFLQPSPHVFDLPEKVLQFGTGVLLRGLPDFFISEANNQGIFNGRIVVVKSTNTGSTDAFKLQDNLYTVCSRGVENGKPVAQHFINASISRVINAQNDWHQVLRLAESPELLLIVSNTTEVGIQLKEESIFQHPPDSFPGKLLSVLFHRYQFFKGDNSKGLVIVPTELIPGNADVLLDIVLKLCSHNNLDKDFVHWLTTANQFCNSLVDRIVPGNPAPEMAASIQAEVGYSDDLLIVAEPYKLWAIEGDESVREKLSFCKTDSGVVIDKDITLYRELKLRMLNGTHTLSCGLAFLRGHEYVVDAMNDLAFSRYVKELMLEEIAAGIPVDIDKEVVGNYGQTVLDRFSNPYIQHKWLGITVQYTSKIIMRVLPVLLKYVEGKNAVPEKITEGIAGWICFMRPVKLVDGFYYGEWKGNTYPIKDDQAKWFYDNAGNLTPEDRVKKVLNNFINWGQDITIAADFSEKVLYYYHLLIAEQ